MVERRACGICQWAVINEPAPNPGLDPTRHLAPTATTAALGEVLAPVQPEVGVLGEALPPEVGVLGESKDPNRRYRTDSRMVIPYNGSHSTFGNYSKET